MLLCRNVTLRSPNTTVSERDTRSPNTTVSKRDTRSPNTTVSERDTRSIYLIILVHQAFFMSRRYLNREDLRLEIQQSHHSDHHNYTITTYKRTIKHIEDFTIPPNTYRSQFRVYLSHRNKP